MHKEVIISSDGQGTLGAEEHTEDQPPKFEKEPTMIEKAAAKKRQDALDKVLSTKAKKIGMDTGVTAEFIV